ncbi:MAG: ABC transporter permease, partial [Actinomycetota bacterium]|nr:ABC transporter permease [Actinomycetota bacterium]
MSRRQIGNPGAHMWARTDLRRRWLSLIVLGILAGSAAGLTMASLAGARRTETAFPRLRVTTHAADAVVFPGQVGGFVTDWAKLRARPYVESVAPWSLLFGAMNGQPGGVLFGPIDDTWLQQVDRPVVVRGRMWDPKRPDEVVEDEDAATQLPLGSTFTFRFYANGKSDLDGIPPNGPTRHLKVVGIIRETSEFLFAPGLIIPSPALLEQDRAHLTHIENAHVRLKDPAKDMAVLKRDVPTLLQRGTPVLDLHQVVTRVSTAISVERSALLLLSAAVAAAGLVFVGQALSRSVATIDADADALRAMGFARRDISFAATAPHVLVAVVGAIA